MSKCEIKIVNKTLALFFRGGFFWTRLKVKEFIITFTIKLYSVFVFKDGIVDGL